MPGAHLHTHIHKPAGGGAPKQIVLMLHGLGSDGRDLIGLAPYWASILPDAVFVSPDAPFPCDMAPMGYQWFSLQDWSEEAIRRGVERAAPILDTFITEQLERYGLGADRLVLMGFSQGCMMSLYAGPRYPEKIAGILGYSGALVSGEELIGNPDIHKSPVCLIHGDADGVVPVTAYHHARKTLEKAGFTLSGGVTAGLAHGIDSAGIETGAKFLSEALG